MFDISVKEFSQMLKHVFDIQNTALIKEKEFTKDDMDCYLLLGENQKVYPTKIIIISFKSTTYCFIFGLQDPFALESSKDEISLIVNSFKISG